MNIAVTEFGHQASPSLLRLQAVFHDVLGQRWRTRLQGGAQEPFYQAATDIEADAIIFFTRDYFASALHEIAHWCVAGEERRKRDDYGYWYAPDGRNAEQQAAFEKVEVVPQAYEWIFSVACASPFRVSADNLAMPEGAGREFKIAIWQQVRAFCETGLPLRPRLFTEALAQEFKQPMVLNKNNFNLDSIL